MNVRLTFLAASLLLAACSSPAPRLDSGVQPPSAWQSADTPGALQSNRQWWTQFGSPELERLVDEYVDDPGQGENYQLQEQNYNQVRRIKTH